MLGIWAFVLFVSLPSLMHGREVPKLVPFTPRETDESQEHLLDAEQMALTEQSFRDFRRNGFNTPFLTWKAVHVLSSMLRKPDYLRRVKHILRSFEDENLALFQYNYLWTLRKVPRRKHRRLIETTLQHIDTQQSLFVILADPVARILAKEQPASYQEFHAFEQKVRQQAAQKKVFLYRLLMRLQGARKKS
ncbi:hypothetical protein EIL50_01505 [bacterium NHP-B]|nr:hypothetical protein EIL50_01505 [bacterium NHP-B]